MIANQQHVHVRSRLTLVKAHSSMLKREVGNTQRIQLTTYWTQPILIDCRLA